jgi:hypothetical protein
MAGDTLDPVGERCNFAVGPAFALITKSSCRRYAVSIFQIRQKKSGAVLWTGSAPDERAALDAMAREAGYRDYSAIPESLRAEEMQADRLELVP